MNRPAIVIRDIHHYGGDLTVPEAVARLRDGGPVTVTVPTPPRPKATRAATRATAPASPSGPPLAASRSCLRRPPGKRAASRPLTAPPVRRGAGPGQPARRLRRPRQPPERPRPRHARRLPRHHRPARRRRPRHQPFARRSRPVRHPRPGPLLRHQPGRRPRAGRGRGRFLHRRRSLLRRGRAHRPRPRRPAPRHQPPARRGMKTPAVRKPGHPALIGKLDRRSRLP